MELQDNRERFERNGIWICAISYDPVEALREFSEKFHIAYPLLSDADSAVIRRFGILNTNIPEEHPWYGVPYPGTFMVDEQGTVINKSFHANHAIRDSVARMLQDVFQVRDAQRGVIQTVETDSLTATAYLSSGTVRPGQVLTFTAEIEVKEGRHIYSPLTEGYIPTALTFQDVHDVHFGEVLYPEPKPHHVEALDETLQVYDGRIVLKAPVQNGRKEAFVVQARLEYQACDDRECYLPERIDFELPLNVLDNVWD